MQIGLHDDSITTKRKHNNQLAGKSIDNYDLGFKSEATKETYHKKLKQFLDYIELSPDEFLERTKANPKATERLIMTYIQKRKENDHVSGSTVRCLRDALKLFFEMNDLENSINWNKISKIMPHAKKVGSDRAPSIDEIRKIISNWDLRFNAIVLMQSSGGFRLGAFDYLNFRDIEPIFERKDDIRGNTVYEVVPYNEYEKCLDQGWRFLCAKVTIYHGEPEQYYTFITPEAFHALWRYKKERERYGEIITPSSPLVRDKWDYVKGANLNSPNTMIPKRLSSRSIANQLGRRLWALGFRNEHKKVHEFKQNHGFRKFFETNAKRVLRHEDVERLKGHLSNYYKPDFYYLLKEYLKAIPYLTISETSQLKDELEKRVIESDMRVGELERINLLLRSKIEDMEQETQELKEMVKRVFKIFKPSK